MTQRFRVFGNVATLSTVNGDSGISGGVEHLDQRMDILGQRISLLSDKVDLALDRLLAILLFVRDEGRQLKRLEATMKIDFTDLNAELARNTDVVRSTKALIVDIRQKLADALAAADSTEAMAQVKAIHDALQANDDELAASVAENTPGAPKT